ncbi:MAG: hypothetical protein RJA99_1089 [Pseudomonadota bacterium]|jgi:tripartite-type tricarboxylate transporter receptor subunit TctC
MRSMLFVPGDSRRKFDKARGSGADALCTGGALAQPYPAKPIRLVVPFAVGSGTDIVTRAITEAMQRGLGTTSKIRRAGIQPE